MKVLIQCVKNASVLVNGEIVSRINKGYLLFVGIEKNDDETIVDKISEKIINLRINQDKNGKTNLSIKDIDGEILSVSQFTLCATLEGRRPSFSNAAIVDKALGLFERFNHNLEKSGIIIKKGVFKAHMEVSLLNDGPFTIFVDSKEI